MALSDQEILKRIIEENMISRMAPLGVSRGTISSGVSSAGYDVRIGYEFKVAKSIPYYLDDPDNPRIHDLREPFPLDVLDPKNPNPDLFEDVTVGKGQVLMLYPGEYALGPTIEHFQIPRDIIVVVLGKSTYARSQIVINCTPAEPDWEGHLIVEIFNAGTLPVPIYCGEGIAQFLFFTVEGEVLTSYKDKQGKYNFQKKNQMLSKVK